MSASLIELTDFPRDLGTQIHLENRQQSIPRLDLPATLIDRRNERGGPMSAKPDQFSDFQPGPRGGGVSLGWKVLQGDQGDGPRPPTPQTESGQCCVYN